MIDLYERGLAKYPWWPDWRGQCVAIIGGGPSIRNQNLSILKGRIHVAVVNESYKLCPWAEILYSCDSGWWRLRQVEIEKFKGLKIGFEIAGAPADIKKITIKKKEGSEDWINELLLDEPGIIGSGGNSGFQLMNLVLQFGATGIALVGIDMNLAGGVHWHGRHPDQLRNPSESVVNNWRRDMDAASPEFLKLGIDVVNCSPTSILKNYRKATLDQMLERWGL